MEQIAYRKRAKVDSKCSRGGKAEIIHILLVVSRSERAKACMYESSTLPIRTLIPHASLPLMIRAMILCDNSFATTIN
jgi:hypothetical protein